MLRSMWTGVTGLNSHLTDMDVLSNNIANVNTTAYKTQKYSFSDVMYQTMSNATAATATKGSIAAKQVGLGTRTGSIATNISTQGSAVTTEQPLDMMISGSNFFVINTGNGTAYTRDGSFTLDANGDLVTKNNGYYVMGWTDVSGDTVATGGAVTMISVINEENNTTPAEATSAETLSGNIDKLDTAINSSTGKTLAMAVIGADGNSYDVYFKLTNGDDDDDTTYTMTLDHITDSDGNAVTGFTATSYDLVYSATDGTFASVNGDTAGTGVILNLPAEIGSLTLDFSGTTNYASLSGSSSTIKITRGDSEGNGQGRAAGVMNGFTVSSSGVITINYTNGATKTIGQIATAQFANASGLVQAGDNLYEESANSGPATLMDVTENGGSISTGVLEGSSVDLAEEFTTMIVAQRGMQANSKVITTSDEMLQVLRDLKR